MAYATPKTDWSPADGVTNVDLNRVETNISEISNAYVATGTATEILLDCGELSNARVINFIANNGNAGAATTINGIPVYRPATTSAPTFVSGKMYTVWYVAASNCFFLKASAEGTALASQVLKGCSFSNDTDTGLIGTLDLTNLISANIRAGVTINGIAGKSSVVETSDVTATSSQILSGYFAYKNGVKQTGNIAVKSGSGSATVGTQTSKGSAGKIAIIPPKGYYDGAANVYFNDANFKAANILAGVSMLGLTGTGGLRVKTGKVNSSSETKPSITITGLAWAPKYIILVSMKESSAQVVVSVIIYAPNTNLVASSNIVESYGWTNDEDEDWHNFSGSDDVSTPATYANGTWKYTAPYPNSSEAEWFRNLPYQYIAIG